MKHIEIINKNLKKVYILAKISAFFGDVPVVAMVISEKTNKVVGYGINNRQFKHNVTGHSEVNAIKTAERKIKDWRMDGYAIFSTLKPCDMCAKIIETARIKKIYYLIDQPNVINNSKLEYEQVYFPGNKYVEKIKLLLTSFFKNMR